MNGNDQLTFVDNTSVQNSVDLCIDDMSAMLTDGMGNSFSFAMPPVCAYDR